MADLSVAIVSYNTCDVLASCLGALFDAAHCLELEVIVVDNGSTDGTQQMLTDGWSDVTLIENRANIGFAAANNLALGRASAPVALLLNSDAFVTADAIQHALSIMNAHSRVGIVGTRLLNTDGSVQAEDGSFPSFLDDIKTSIGLDRLMTRRSGRRVEPGPTDWVQGACMFVRMSAVHEIGGLDERFFMYSEEIDWCRRCWKAGWEVWYLPDADVIHIGGASSSNDTRRRLALYTSRLGFRRRVSGPFASSCLWILMLAGLATRVVMRPIAERIAHRRIGNQTPTTDISLLAELLRVDPLARWVRS